MTAAYWGTSMTAFAEYISRGKVIVNVRSEEGNLLLRLTFQNRASFLYWAAKRDYPVIVHNERDY